VHKGKKFIKSKLELQEVNNLQM